MREQLGVYFQTNNGLVFSEGGLVNLTLKVTGAAKPLALAGKVGEAMAAPGPLKPARPMCLALITQPVVVGRLEGIKDGHGEVAQRGLAIAAARHKLPF